MSAPHIDVDVLCIGAGFSGLAAAHTLLKAKPTLGICVLEAKDRVGGRTHLQDLKCADADGKDDVHSWEFGGMWVGRTQHDILELLRELNIETYEQYTTGIKCIRLNSDSKARTYSSNLPSVGILATLDLGQSITRIERLIKAVGSKDPWKHPQAAYLDSITFAELINKLSFTDKVKEMMVATTRAMFGADPPQINALYFLYYCACSGGSFEELLGATAGTAQEYKIVGGSQNICMKLMENFIGTKNIKLSTPVTRIEQTEELVVVHTASSDLPYHAKQVILAIPPQQILKIEFLPALPNTKARLYKLMPTGHIMKVIITYRKAYWRMEGYSGEIVTTDPRPTTPGAIGVVYDATSEHGHPALVAFIGGDQATLWGDKSKEERRNAVLISLSEHLNIPALMDPIDYGEKDWGKETYNGGCPVDVMTCGAMRFHKELQSPLGRLEFAGTETSEIWCGYLSGAVYAGKRAAKKVLEKLSE